MIRKRKSLPRRDQPLRDTRKFVVACDDTYAPRQYFELLANSRVEIQVLPAHPGEDHQHAIQRLREFKRQPGWGEDDELWVVLDVDHLTEGNHIKGFLRSLREASDLGARVALSRPCVELWLLLHGMQKIDFASVERCRDLTELLRNAFGAYDKTALQAAHYPEEAIARACLAAAARDREVRGGDIPEAATTRVYELLKSIYRGCTPASVPEELRDWLLA